MTDYYYFFNRSKNTNIFQKLNAFNAKATDTLISVDLLNSTDPDDDALKEVADMKLYLAMDFNKIDNFRFSVPGLKPMSAVMSTAMSIDDKHMAMFSPQINHISFKLPPMPPFTRDNQEVGSGGG